ncbi:hypothetical protein ALO94_201149 [Pseudomonas syringae pv. spinaceae]|uniref:Permease n=1 Tax=Pseudomonas syringae pv. spinaceae TaxID=264459 RepID=A0A0Q0HLJ7_PSESX|nr:hypothetical protein ALO94_201149 [Pseudomonas syringae pv. spinaceae]
MSAQLDVDVATLGNLDGVFQRLGQIAEQFGHFFRAFQVLLVAVVVRAPRIVQRPAFADAHAGLVRLEISLVDKAHIVGRDQRCTVALGQGNRGVQMLFIIGAIGTLHFYVEAVRKHGQPFAQQLVRFSWIATEQRHADLAFLGCGQRNHALAGLRDPLALNDDLAITLTLDETTGNQLGEVAIALGVHGQQADATERGVFIAAGQPQIDATDRLDPGALSGFVELDQRTHVVLIGHRHGRHVHAGQRLDQRFDPDQTVNQRVLGVQA